MCNPVQDPRVALAVALIESGTVKLTQDANDRFAKHVGDLVKKILRELEVSTEPVWLGDDRVVD